MQNRYFAYFSDFSHIGVNFRILICEFAYAWRPWVHVTNNISACVLPYINRCRDLHPTTVFRVTNFGDYGLHSKVLVIANRITCEPN